MFAYFSRRDKPICTKLGMLITSNQEENIRGSKLRKNFLSSIPSEDGFCRSDAKHDRRRAPRPNLFVSARRLQDLRLQIWKLPWIRIPVKMFGLSITFSFDKQGYLSSDKAFWKLSGNKDWEKCKHLSDFLSVSLRALYWFLLFFTL
jgi:hypothetical protein